MTIDEAIALTNQRLKSAKIRIAIERRGNCLWLRGTLPPKPHIDRVDRYRQKVSLGANATLAGLQYAEQKAKLMGAQLDLGKFDWADWMEVSPQAKEITVGEWVTRFEQDYWAKFKRTPDKEENWKKDYRYVFSKLPGDKTLSLEVLLDFILAASLLSINLIKQSLSLALARVSVRSKFLTKLLHRSTQAFDLSITHLAATGTNPNFPLASFSAFDGLAESSN